MLSLDEKLKVIMLAVLEENIKSDEFLLSVEQDESKRESIRNLLSVLNERLVEERRSI